MPPVTTCSPWWLRHLLTLAVVGPAAGFIALCLWDIHGPVTWAASDAPGFGLCGMYVLVPIAVGVIWLAVRAFLTRDAELLRSIAAGCWLCAAGLSISLGEAATIGLGLKAGRIPPVVLASVAGARLYFLAFGLGHWLLARQYAGQTTD